MTTPHDENSPGMNRSRNSFFYRSLSPCSFERLRHEDSDYFYKPRRGPSTSKANITITRPIKTLETVTKFVELLSQNKTLSPSKPVESESFPPKFDDQKCSSQYSSLLSMDGGDLSSKSSSTSALLITQTKSRCSTSNRRLTSIWYLGRGKHQY